MLHLLDSEDAVDFLEVVASYLEALVRLRDELCTLPRYQKPGDVQGYAMSTCLVLYVRKKGTRRSDDTPFYAAPQQQCIKKQNVTSVYWRLF